MGSPSKPGRCKQLSQRKHRLQKYKGISVTIHITCKLAFLSSQVFFNRSSICMQAQKTNLTVFPKTLVVSCKMTLFSLFIYFNCCFFPLSCWWILSFFFPPSKFHMQSNSERQPFADHFHQFKESLLISYLQKYTYKAVRKSSIDKQINSSTISSSNHFWRKSRWVPTSQTLAKMVWKLRGPSFPRKWSCSRSRGEAGLLPALLLVWSQSPQPKQLSSTFVQALGTDIWESSSFQWKHVSLSSGNQNDLASCILSTTLDKHFIYFKSGSKKKKKKPTHGLLKICSPQQQRDKTVPRWNTLQGRGWQSQKRK